MNTALIIGTIKTMSDVNETNNSNKVMNMTIEVERPFKNGQGYYDVDYIDVIL
jgi:single-stranded DNA-binding protein